MNGKKARAARQADPTRFAAIKIEHAVRDSRAADTIATREVLEIERQDARQERIERQKLGTRLNPGRRRI